MGTTVRSGSETQQRSANLVSWPVGGVITPIRITPAGCVPAGGAGALGSKAGQIDRPGFHRFDFSLFKNIPNQRALLTAVPVGVLQHSQSSELQRS